MDPTVEPWDDGLRGAMTGFVSGNGWLATIDDIIGFHADLIAELPAALEEAVNDYISTSRKLGRTPQKP